MNEPCRVLLVSADLAGGTGSHVSALLDELDAEEFQVRVLCHGPMIEDFSGSAPVRRVRKAGWWDRFPVAQLRRLWDLRAEVRRWRPHVVHTYFFWPALYARALRARGVVRYLVENREDEGFNVGRKEVWALKRTARLADRVICVSRGVAEHVRRSEGLGAEQIRVIHNGVRVASPPPTEARRAELRSELGLAPGKPLVGLVANLNRPVKGVDHFIASAPLILREVPEARFLILGEGHLRPALERQAEELGVRDRVVFAGFRSNVQEFYALMDVSTLTSLSEGLSITLLESMTLGVPVVVTRVGGNPELVDDGESGLLVEPRDHEGFAAAVTRVLRDPELAERLAGRAREKAEAFSMAKVAARYAEVYRGGASREPAGAGSL